MDEEESTESVEILSKKSLQSELKLRKALHSKKMMKRL